VVRKLAIPMLQINVAPKQVSMAGPCIGFATKEKAV
jgi:hypothetical protein